MNSELYRRMAEVERVHWWYQGRNAIICQFLHGVSLPENARILDVGCGTGALTERLTEFGSVVACDPSDFAVSQIRPESQIVAIKPEQLEGQPQWKGYFDLIGFFDVLEHASSDTALLEQYLPYLKPAGTVVASVPAWKIFWGDHDVAAGHFRRYRLATLVKACDAVGLRLERATYFNLLLAPLVFLVRISQKFGTTKSECGDLTLPARPLNTLLKWIFLLEGHWLRVATLPFGVSLLASFRKPAAVP